jgi:hypothetical protein
MLCRAVARGMQCKARQSPALVDTVIRHAKLPTHELAGRSVCLQETAVIARIPFRQASRQNHLSWRALLQRLGEWQGAASPSLTLDPEGAPSGVKTPGLRLHRQLDQGFPLRERRREAAKDEREALIGRIGGIQGSGRAVRCSVTGVGKVPLRISFKLSVGAPNLERLIDFVPRWILWAGDAPRGGGPAETDGGFCLYDWAGRGTLGRRNHWEAIVHTADMATPTSEVAILSRCS